MEIISQINYGAVTTLLNMRGYEMSEEQKLKRRIERLRIRNRELNLRVKELETENEVVQTKARRWEDLLEALDKKATFLFGRNLSLSRKLNKAEATLRNNR